MADEDYQSTPDNRQDQPSTADEIEAARLAEIAKTQQAISLVNAAKQEEASLVTPPRNRIYMGPMVGNRNDSPQEFFQHNPQLINLMPPAPPVGSVARDPALRGITQDQYNQQQRELYSDEGVQRQRNVMIYDAMKKFQAGDRSPENMALVLGRAAPLPMTAYQKAEIEHRKVLEKQNQQRIESLNKPLSDVDKSELNTGLAQFKLDEAAARKELAKAHEALAIATDESAITSATEAGNRALGDIRKAQIGRDKLIGKFRKTPAGTSSVTVKSPTPPVQPPSAPTATASTGKMVRVIGPGNKRGSVPEGTTLPEGWKLAQ